MMQRIRKRPWMIPALLLVLVFAAGLILEAVKPLGVFAADPNQRLSDPPTNASEDYEDALGSTSSTRYNGRVWADKSVYTDDVETDIKIEGGNYTVPIGNADFLLSYSLLAATTEVEGQSLVPLDVVFVIDLSDSMVGDKIRQTVAALNQSVHSLMTGNPDTRIGVVTYNDHAQVLLPLDHYTKAEGEETYFTLSEDELSLQTHVVDSNEDDWEAKASMGSWTNIHMGIDTGMDLLLSADTKTTSGEVRHPALMLMSDGAPTASGDDTTVWWDPSGVSGTGYVNDSGLDAFKAILNASYQKQRVSDYYGMDMKVYTVGVGVSSWDQRLERETAEVTLNPKKWSDVQSSGLKELWNTWESYQSGNNVTVGNQSRQYIFTHPSDNIVDSLFYNDAYISASAAENIVAAFEQVIEQIVVTGAVPTEVGKDPIHSGYVTYVDPIGKYMEVTAMCGLLWDDRIYEIKNIDTNEDGTITTYTYSGDMESPVYGYNEASEILITVTTDDNGDQTLTVKVPAALIPLRTNKVTLNVDGTVENEWENNGPLQLFYTVSLRDYVKEPGSEAAQEQEEPSPDVCVDPNQITVQVPTGEEETQTYVNLGALTEEYIQTHTNPDGTIRFYPNLYTGRSENQAGVEATVGDAYITFDPATTNPFYSVQQDTLLYSDSGCNTPATDINGPLYVKVPYYDGTKLTFDALERTGMYQLGDDGEVKMVDGQLYLKAGVRANLRESVMEKGEDEHGVSNNRSGTAETYRYPIYQTGEQEGNILVWLGNNGVENLPVLTGDLNISKTVTGNKGELDKGFVFDITVQRGTVAPTGVFQATKKATTDTGTTEESVTVNFEKGKAQVTLQHGQSIIIHGLPSSYIYTVTEQDPTPDKDVNLYNGEDYVVSATQDGKTMEWTEGDAYTCTGTICYAQQAQIAYINDLEVPLTDYSFIKVDGKEFDQTNLEEAILLPGAQFTLYHYTGDDWDTDSNALLETPQNIPDWETVMTVTSDKDGVVLMENLQAGRYRLVETKAPDGYQLPKGQWNFLVSRDKETGTWAFDIGAVQNAAQETPAMAWVDGNFYLMNYTPIDPPITGGDGGEDFRIGGGLLMLTGMALAAWWAQSSPRKRREFL